MVQTQINSLFLTSLLLAEITRYKWKGKGAGFSLTHPAIEKQARKTFAEAFGGGLTEKSKPELFIGAIGKVHKDNGTYDRFEATMKNFKLNAADFEITIQ